MINSKLITTLTALSIYSVSGLASSTLDITQVNNTNPTNTVIMDFGGNAITLPPLNDQRSTINLSIGSLGPGAELNIIGSQEYSTIVSNTQTNSASFNNGEIAGTSAFRQIHFGNVLNAMSDPLNPAEEIEFSGGVLQDFGAGNTISQRNTFLFGTTGAGDLDLGVLDALVQSSTGNTALAIAKNVNGDLTQDYDANVILNTVEIGTMDNVDAGAINTIQSSIIGNDMELHAVGGKLEDTYTQTHSVSVESKNETTIGAPGSAVDIGGGNLVIQQTQVANQLVTSGDELDIAVVQTTTSASTSNVITITNVESDGSVGFNQSITGNSHVYTIN